jgi:uncharacterized protein YkwD
MKKLLLFLTILSFAFGTTQSSDTLRVVFTDIENQKNDALERLNVFRQNAGMVAFSRNSLLDQSSQNHADYLAYNNTFSHYESNSNSSYYTGYEPSERIGAVGYSWQTTGENISAGNTQDGVDSIEQLFAAIYHRFGFLTFSNNEVGVGFTSLAGYAYENVYVYNMANQGNPNTTQSQNPEIVIWPSDHSTDVLPAFYEESPDPLPDYGVSGYPVSIQFNSYYYSSTSVETFKLYDSSGNEVKNTRLLSSQTDPNNHMSPMHFALFPLERLDYGKVYTAYVSYTADGVSGTKQWSFRTRYYDAPMYTVTSNSQTLSIKANQTYIIYFEPQNANDSYNSWSYSSGITLEQLDPNTYAIKANSNSYITVGSKTVNFSIGSSDSAQVVVAESFDTTSVDTGDTTAQTDDSTSPITSDASLLYDNWNDASVSNDTTKAPVFTIDENYMITYLDVYQWNDGQGYSDGDDYIAFYDGINSYGPFAVTLKTGPNGTPNAHWVSRPFFELPAGTYQVRTSSDQTWSSNAASNNTGFAKVQGIPISKVGDYASDISGHWDTNFGGLTIQMINDYTATGVFESETGGVAGAVIENYLVGYWKDNSYPKECGWDNEWSGLFLGYFEDGVFKADYSACSDESTYSQLNTNNNKWYGTLQSPLETSSNQFTYSLSKDTWHLYGAVEDMSPITSFISNNGSSKTTLWVFRDNSWLYNENIGSIQRGEGFWIKHYEQDALYIEEYSTSSYNHSFNSGWNLVAATEDLLDMSSLYQQAQIIWTYTDSWISNPNSIQKGFGFWVKMP